ncbi:MAG: pyrroloquinoline quinone biosynthesis peptide chaperone PqqD [Pseudomonadota bacterium]
MNPPVFNCLTLRTGYRLQFEVAQSSWVLLFPEGMIQLNDTAGIILQQFLQPQTLDAAITALEQQFPGEDIRNDIIEFVADAREQRWLQHVD